MYSFIRKVAVACAATVALSGVTVVATSAPASAHTGDLPVTAVCNTVTGEYDFTAKLVLSNVPSGKNGSTKWRIGTSSFQGTPTSDSGMDRGPISSVGNQTLTLVGTASGNVKFSLPGTTTGYGPWFYAFTKWSGATQGSDGQLKDKLKGDCKPATQSNPPKQEITCSNIYRDFGRPLVNGDHINVTIERQNGSQYQVNVYVDRNIAGGYDTLGLRYSDGSTRPLTETEVKKGRIWLDLSTKVTDKYYKVQFVQINESENWPNLVCGTVETIPVPAKPSQNDPCGPNNATWNVPADTDKIDWTLTSDGRLTAATKNGLKFSDGTTSKDFGKAIDSNVPCPDVKVPVPAKPTYQDPCGPNNASWNVPADTTSLDWTLSNDGVLTVATKTGYVFSDGTTSKSFGKAPDSGEKCTVPVPPAPSLNDPCGPNNATWNVPADTADYAWALRSDGHLFVTVKGDKTFPDGSTMKDYGKPVDSNVPCPDVQVPVPAAPQQTDPCGPNNASWVVPADTASVDWTLTSDGRLVAATKQGYVFKDGSKSKDFGLPKDSNEPCKIPVPVQPTQTDPCGPNNASWNVPADTTDVDWNLSDGVLTATALQGQVFDNGQTVINYGVVQDSNVPCPLTEAVATAPSSVDKCEPSNGSTKDTFTVPNDTEFQYGWNGGLVAPGTYSANQKLIVLTAIAKPGYILADGAQDTWRLEFTKEKCFVPIKVRGAAKRVDKCRTSGDQYAVRGEKGVVYTVKGKVVREGVWNKTKGAKKIVVKAKAASSSYKLVGKTRWVLKFTNRPCGGTPSVPSDTGALRASA